MIRIVHIAAHVGTPQYAVFTAADGAPRFEPVVAFACVEISGGKDDGHRAVAGISLGKHPEPADFRPEFVGYAQDTYPVPWVEPCKARRAWIADQERAAAGQKIIVPGGEAKIVYPGSN